MEFASNNSIGLKTAQMENTKDDPAPNNYDTE